MSWETFNQLKEANNDFEKEADRECLECDLEAIGIFGLQDPLRDTIIDSIARLKVAGITTIMCTGDNIDTATAISLNAGIVAEEDLGGRYTCMTGEKFREFVGTIKKIADPKYPDDREKDTPTVGDIHKFKKVKAELRVLARSSPEDKYLLVTGL